MLVAKKDDVSLDASIDPSNPMAEPELGLEPMEEDDDGWVIVETRRITILIPPAPPPVHPETKSREMNCIPTKSRRAVLKKRRRRKHSKDEVYKLAATTGNDAQIDGVISRPQESNHNQTSIHFNGKASSRRFDGDGNAAALGKRRFGPADTVGGAPRPAIGALSVVNRRLRALNLEWKLRGLGGLRRWLISRGLGRFVRVLEREEVGKYQLANLTMSKLKDMGADAVGPRRKLMHAIDGLCHPYYFEALQ